MPEQEVLVTGATGFAGGHLARYLSRHRMRVRALARPGSRTDQLTANGIRVAAGDIREAADVDRAVAGVHQIYHLAALYRSARHPDQTYYDVNVRGTQHILDSARRHGVQRVVHCSTVGVHGDLQHWPADEQAPYRPGDIYQRTKLEAELLAREAFVGGLPGVIFRPAAIYGPGDTRFLKLFRSIQRGTFRMIGSGAVNYHLVFVEDLVRGIELCGTREVAVGETFILAGDSYVTVAELAALVANAVGVPLRSGQIPIAPVLAAARLCEAVCRPLGLEPPLHRRRLDFFRKNRAFSIEKARQMLGFEPQVDLPSGLRQTADWYAAQGWIRPRKTGP